MKASARMAVTPWDAAGGVRAGSPRSRDPGWLARDSRASSLSVPLFTRSVSLGRRFGRVRSK